MAERPDELEPESAHDDGRLPSDKVPLTFAALIGLCFLAYFGTALAARSAAPAAAASPAESRP